MNTTTPASSPSGFTLFLSITFTTSWGCWLIAIMLGEPAMSFPTVIPYVLGAFGPIFGALVVRVIRARRRVPAPSHAVRIRLGTLGWLPLLLVIASASVLAASIIANLPDGPLLDLDAAARLVENGGGIVPFLVSMLVVGPLSEEPGWRATAHPRMRASMGRFQTGLLLGTIWGVWHLPLFFVSGTVQEAFGLFSPNGLLYLVSVIPMAILAGYGYDRAGVAGAIAVHFGVNTTVALVGVDSPKTQAIVIGIQAIAALTLVAGQRDRPEASDSPQASPSPEQQPVR